MSLSVNDRLSPSLARLASKIKDKKPILEAMGTELAKLSNGSFNNSAWRAAPWAPLKPATLAAKLRAGKSSAILKRNLNLWRSYRPTDLTNNSVTVSTDRPYAGFHQFGTKRAPARPMLPFIGGSSSATLAPWAREKLTKIAVAKTTSLLNQATGQ